MPLPFAVPSLLLSAEKQKHFIEITAKHCSRKLFITYGGGSQTDGCNPWEGGVHFQHAVTKGKGYILKAEHSLIPHCKAVIIFFH
jgi:hypothetical protein